MQRKASVANYDKIPNAAAVVAAHLTGNGMTGGRFLPANIFMRLYRGKTPLSAQNMRVFVMRKSTNMRSVNFYIGNWGSLKPIMFVIAVNCAAVQRRKCKPRPKSKDGQIF
jgi:hypothetical protein